MTQGQIYVCSAVSTKVRGLVYFRLVNFCSGFVSVHVKLLSCLCVCVCDSVIRLVLTFLRLNTRLLKQNLTVLRCCCLLIGQFGESNSISLSEN